MRWRTALACKRVLIMDKQIRLLVAGLVLPGILFLCGCATNPVTGKQDFVLMSEAQEISLGKRAHQQVMQQYRPYHDAALQGYVEGLVKELSRESHRSNLMFHVTVLDSPQINAFALPGGYIYITRGIMAYMNSEAELAGVLGHEIGHVTARHGVRQQSIGTLTSLLSASVGILTGSREAAQIANIGTTALVRGYGRKHELEADRLGAEYLARTGYDPEAMIDVVGILKSQEDFDKQLAKEEGREPRAYHGTFSTHPANDKRLQEVVMAANRFNTAATREANRELFLDYIDGMALGPSEQDGVLRGNKFYHNELNLFVEFPPGWKVDNLPDRLLAQPKSRGTRLQIMTAELHKHQTPKEYLTGLVKGRISGGQNVRTTSFEGYTGYVTLDDAQIGNLPVRVAAVFDSKRAYQIFVTHKDAGSFNRNDSTTLTIIKSLRHLQGGERKLGKPKRIKLMRAKSGDTFAALAEQSSLSHHPVTQLRLLNGMYPNGEPNPGQLIKIVQ